MWSKIFKAWRVDNNLRIFDKIVCQDCDAVFYNSDNGYNPAAKHGSCLNNKFICWECLTYRLSNVLRSQLLSPKEIHIKCEKIKIDWPDLIENN